MEKSTPHLFGGISGAKLSSSEDIDLGNGVILRSTYAHLMAPNLMAFAPPRAGGEAHPAPWRAVNGGFAFDIHVEISVPLNFEELGKDFGAERVIWLIAALMRIAKAPQLSVPVLSKHSLALIPNMQENAQIELFEIGERIFSPPKGELPNLDDELLAWIKKKWMSSGRMLNDNPRFYEALKAFDIATIRGRHSASLLTLWGAIEHLFSPSVSELRFRVSSLMAAYMHPPGPDRLDLYKNMMRLYNERSIAAHSARERDTHVVTGAVVQTYVLLRNALVQMLDEGRVPSNEYLEAALFMTSPAKI